VIRDSLRDHPSIADACESRITNHCSPQVYHL